MAQALDLAASRTWIGVSNDGGRTYWLSPALIGMTAPVVLGLVIAPQILDGASAIVGFILGLVLLLSGGAYVLIVVAPGAPFGMVVRADTRTVAIVRRGLLVRSEILIPFEQVTRLSMAKSADRDGYENSAVEVRTRSGDAWIVPGEADEALLAQLRRVIGIPVRSR